VSSKNSRVNLVDAQGRSHGQTLKPQHGPLPTVPGMFWVTAPCVFFDSQGLAWFVDPKGLIQPAKIERGPAR
jgi:hypothetical protein